MKLLKNILLFIINPFRTFGLGKSSDKIVGETNKRQYLYYILAFILATTIIVLEYFI